MFRIRSFALQRLEVDLFGTVWAFSLVCTFRAPLGISSLFRFLARLKVRQRAERGELLGRILPHVVREDVEVVTTLGHEREAGSGLVLPITAHVRVCKMLPANRLDVLDVNDVT